MATATALALRVSYRVHDKDQAEISAADYLTFVNDAIDDLVAAGWLERQSEDVTTSMVTDTFDYSVPSGFAYVQFLIEEDANEAGKYPGPKTADHLWWIGLVSGTPTFHFDSNLWFPTNGKKIKIVGQKRPTQSIAGSATIVSGMEAFIRERATHYAAGYLAAGVSELSQWRKDLSEISYRNSEKMLAYHPQEFRVRVGSRVVPTR